MAGDKGKLTAVALKSPRIGKHFDSGGLFLHVTPQGGRYWRLKYRFAGKEKLLALGVYLHGTAADILSRDEEPSGILSQQVAATIPAARQQLLREIQFGG